MYPQGDSLIEKKNFIRKLTLSITCIRELDFDRSIFSLFPSTGRCELICVKWWSGRPLSGDICGGKGGEIDRRRSICDGTWGSGDGIGVVDDDEFVLGRSNERFEFLIGFNKFDDDPFGTLSKSSE